MICRLLIVGGNACARFCRGGSSILPPMLGKSPRQRPASRSSAVTRRFGRRPRAPGPPRCRPAFEWARRQHLLYVNRLLRGLGASRERLHTCAERPRPIARDRRSSLRDVSARATAAGSPSTDISFALKGLVRSRRLELPRVAPQRPQRCASTNSATTARGEARGVANAGGFVKGVPDLDANPQSQPAM